MNLILIFILISFNLNAKDFNITALLWSDKIEGQVAMRYGLENYINKFNNEQSHHKAILKTYIAGDGTNGINNQINQFNQTILSKPDIIIIQPTDNAALSDSLLIANKMKIPVIAFDQYISDGKLLSFITSDNYQAGVLNAEYINNIFPKEKIINIAVFEYPRVSSTIERVDGFFDTLRKLKRKFKVAARYEAVEYSEGIIAAKQFLKEFPQKGSVDVIFTVNDGGGLGVVETLVKEKRNEIIHVTVDGDPKSIQNIIKGNITVINAAQFCAEIGYQSAKAAIDFLENKKVAKRIFVPTFPVTKETVKYYNGWKGEMPKNFTKKWNSIDKKWVNTLKIK